MDSRTSPGIPRHLRNPSPNHVHPQCYDPKPSTEAEPSSFKHSIRQCVSKGATQPKRRPSELVYCHRRRSAPRESHVSHLTNALQPTSLPPSFITSFVIKCFAPELDRIDFPQALTAMDYLKDLEVRRRREVLAALDKLGIDRNDIGHRDKLAKKYPGVLQWVVDVEQKEREVRGTLHPGLYWPAEVDTDQRAVADDRSTRLIVSRCSTPSIHQQLFQIRSSSSPQHS